MQNRITITNHSPQAAVIDIEGVIGVPEEWQFDEPAKRVATYESFRKTIEQLQRLENPEVTVNIRSTGGNVNDALLIFDALCSIKGRITTRCFGYVASAATIIAQAASEGCREISENSLYLIHRSVSSTEGNAQEMAHSAELLGKTDERIASIYAQRSGMPVEKFTALMHENNGCGRWLSAEEVLAAGLADKIVQNAGKVKTKAADGKTSKIMNIAKQWKALLELIGLAETGLTEGVEQSPAAVGAEGCNERKVEAAHETVAETVEIPASKKEVASPETVENHSGRIAELQNRISTLEAQNARLNAAATPTKPKEDPSPREMTRTSNQEAYLSDIQNFR